MIAPAGPESLWPSQEFICDAGTLHEYALCLEAFINDEPVLNAEERRLLGVQAVEMLNALATPLYVDQQVVCEGTYTMPVTNDNGAIVGERVETGILQGISAGFNFQIEEFPADEVLGTVSFAHIELAHAIVVGSRSGFGKLGRGSQDYLAFAPLLSNRLLAKEEYDEVQAERSLGSFKSDDTLILGIQSILNTDGLDLAALNQLFLQICDQPDFDPTDYLTYLNTVTNLGGKEFILQADQAFLESDTGQYSLHKLKGSTIEGVFKSFYFSMDIRTDEEDVETVILPAGLCISLEVSTTDALYVFVVPAECIDGYSMEE